MDPAQYKLIKLSDGKIISIRIKKNGKDKDRGIDDPEYIIHRKKEERKRELRQRIIDSLDKVEDFPRKVRGLLQTLSGPIS
jgi:protein associated with RNAse G/E